MADSAKQYLIIDEKGNGHLKVRKSPDGPLDHGLMGGAWAALFHNYRGKSYEGPSKEEAKAKLRALYKSEGLDTPSETAQAAQLSQVRDGLVRVPLAYTNAPGTTFDHPAAGKFTITSGDLEDMRANLAQREVPIDYEHLSAKAPVIPPGWAKAAGWLAKPDAIEAFTEGRQILWGWARFTPSMLAMIKDEEYRYCSIDFNKNVKDETGEDKGTRLLALAMTNRPFLQDLPPIEISPEDYQQLMGMSAREDGKLAAITLSDTGPRLMNPEAVHVPAIVGARRAVPAQIPSASAEKKEKTMSKKLTMKCTADGKHQVFDGDEEVGEVEHEHLRQYAQTHAGMQPGGDGKKASEVFFSQLGDAEILRFSQDDNAKALSQAKALIEKGRRSETAAVESVVAEPGVVVTIQNGKPVAKLAATDAQLLSACIDQATGTLKLSEVDRLMDEGKIKPSAYRRASAQEAKVTQAFKDGKIKPTARAKALELCLSNEGAFDEFVAGAKPIVDIETHGTPRAADGGQPATQQFNSLVAEQMKDLKLSEAAARDKVLSTKEGASLWEAMRLEEIEANKGTK